MAKELLKWSKPRSGLHAGEVLRGRGPTGYFYRVSQNGREFSWSNQNDSQGGRGMETIAEAKAGCENAERNRLRHPGDANARRAVAKLKRKGVLARSGSSSKRQNTKAAAAKKQLADVEKRATKAAKEIRTADARKAIERGGSGKIAGYDVHPAAKLFPLMSESELSELAQDIKARGQTHAVVLHEGKVLDGRNRLLACELAGVAPRTTEWDCRGGSAAAFVAGENLKRRHLTGSQRAVIALELLPLFKAEAKAAQREGGRRGGLAQSGKLSAPGTKLPTVHAAKKAAEATGAAERSVARAQAVQAKAPHLLERVKSGELTLKEAELHATRGTTGDDDQDERFTPRTLIDALHRAYRFDVDAAAHPDSPATKLIGRHWTKKHDGLKGDWEGLRVFWNCPFSEVEKWVEHTDRVVRSGKCPLAIGLMPATRTEQPFWQKYIEPYRDRGGWQLGGPHQDDVRVTTRFLLGRTKFGYPGDPEGEKSGSPPFTCVLVMWSRRGVNVPELRELDLVTGTTPAEAPPAVVEEVTAKACTCTGFEPAVSSLDPTCVCGHSIKEHALNAGVAGPCRHELLAPAYVAAVKKHVERIVETAKPKRVEPPKPVSFPVTDDDLDAPDGAKVEGYERHGKTWVKAAPELPFTARCSASGCKSDAALGEEKCAAHLVAEDDAAEAREKKTGTGINPATGRPRRIKEAS